MRRKTWMQPWGSRKPSRQTVPDMPGPLHNLSPHAGISDAQSEIVTNLGIRRPSDLLFSITKFLLSFLELTVHDSIFGPLLDIWVILCWWYAIIENYAVSVLRSLRSRSKAYQVPSNRSTSRFRGRCGKSNRDQGSDQRT
jgi:hypothetical protein